MQTVKPTGTTAATKRYYFLATGYVYFHPQGKPEAVESTFLNSVFANDTGVVSASDLGNAQRGLMQNLQNRAEGPVEVVDVQFAAINHLGHMLPSEFHNIPAPAPAAE